MMFTLAVVTMEEAKDTLGYFAQMLQVFIHYVFLVAFFIYFFFCLFVLCDYNKHNKSNKKKSNVFFFVFATKTTADVYYQNSMNLAQSYEKGETQLKLNEKLLNLYAKLANQDFPKASEQLKKHALLFNEYSEELQYKVRQFAARVTMSLGDGQLVLQFVVCVFVCFAFFVCIFVYLC